VTDVVAFGVADAGLGQVVHVAVTPRAGSEYDTEKLLQFCREAMPMYMRPRGVHLWPDTMPRTGNGKLDRPAVIGTLRKRIEETDAVRA